MSMNPLLILCCIGVMSMPIRWEDTSGDQGAFEKVKSLGDFREKTASLAFGDVDGDGDQDLVVANGRHWPGQNRLFINDGKGSFETVRNLSDQMDNTYATPLGDLDGDGDLDIVVGNDRMPSYLLINDGKGVFTRGQKLEEVTSTRSITLADIDKRNGLDILVTNRGKPNRIYFNDGSGRFNQSKTFGSKDDSTIAVAVADLNGDGHNDLALANRDGQPNYVYLGDGTGDFDQSAKYGTGSDETRGVTIADIDGDGFLDIVNANIGQSNAIYFGDGMGGFDRSMRFGNKAASYAVKCAPLDQNSKQMAIVIANVGAQNAVYLKKPDGTFARIPFGAKASLIKMDRAATYNLAVADVDGDGVIEIATANSGKENILFRYTKSSEQQNQKPD